MTYEAKATTRSRQRRRTETEAIRYLDDHTKAFALQRPKSILRIRRARQPMVEAKRIVAQAARRLVRRALQGDDTRPPARADYSDVQELRVRLIRRDGQIAEPLTSMLHRLDGRIARDGLTRDEFEEAASRLWAMVPAVRIGSMALSPSAPIRDLAA